MDDRVDRGQSDGRAKRLIACTERRPIWWAEGFSRNCIPERSVILDHRLIFAFVTFRVSLPSSN